MPCHAGHPDGQGIQKAAGEFKIIKLIINFLFRPVFGAGAIGTRWRKEDEGDGEWKGSEERGARETKREKKRENKNKDKNRNKNKNKNKIKTRIRMRVGIRLRIRIPIRIRVRIRIRIR